MNRIRINRFALAAIAGTSILLGLGALAASPLAADDQAVTEMVSLELTVNGEFLARVMVPTNEMATVDFGKGKGTLGLVPEEVSLRGDEVSLAVYQVTDHLSPRQSRDYVETLDVGLGETGVPARAAERVGQPDFAVKLLGVRLSNR